MTLRNDSELKITQKKLRLLENEYASVSREKPDNPYAQELTLRSLRGMINQLKEEIVRYRARVGVAEKQ